MEKTNFTFEIRRLKNLNLGFSHAFSVCLMWLVFSFQTSSINAQCSLACNGTIQVSLDSFCVATITPSMMLNDTITTCPNGQFSVRVLEYNKLIPGSPVVTGIYVGKTLTVEVTDNISGNRCWGYAKIEDKLPPTIICRRDTIPCFVASQWIPEAFDGCGLDTVLLVDEIIQPLNCNPNYIKQIVRKYIAYDIHGNKSAICADTTLLKRFDTSKVECPKNYTIANNCPISCKDIYYNRIPLDKNGHPSPSYTGVPRYTDLVGGNPVTIDLYPVRDIYCNIAVNYEDIDLGIIGCVHKYMRMWTIREWWCNTEIVRVCIQILEIVDREAPYVHAPYDFDATTDGGYKCQATVVLPPAIVFDSCGGPVRVDVSYPGGILTNKNGGVVILPVGDNVIEYRAYDNCYNSSTSTMTVHVLDRTAPVAICDRETVVSLSIYGTTHVYAKTFDDGSYDDCHIDSFLVRRMDNGAPCGQKISWFRPYAEFCCADVGKTITVIFRAKDKHGNFNDCMVQIEVQDKLKPVCTAPIDLTVSCDFHFNINDLSVFGVMQKDSALFNNKRTIKFIGNKGLQEVVNFHDGFAHDNCDFTITHSFVDNRTQCNVGTIVRTWVVADNNGSDTCRQVIYFHNYSPYNFDSIWWPRDTVLYMCLDPNELTPEKLNSKPILRNEDKCDLVGLSSEDHLFRIVQGGDACYKIIRKWKALDWCQVYYNGTGAHYEFRTHEQIIKIHNLDDPTVNPIPTTDTTVCTLDSCTSGFISLRATGSDICTPGIELAWEYLIDYNNNGIYDIIRSGVGPTINADGRYPLGTHRIKYVFEDRCGNKTAIERLFTIINCKLPTPYCINGVAIDLMPIDTNRDGKIDWGMIEVWASDVDQGSYGACKNPITLSFSSDTTIKSIMFDCNTLGQQTVELWVTDRLTGNQAFCRTFVEVQDNNKACGQTITNTGTINGLVSNNVDNNTMNDVDVLLTDNATPTKQIMSTIKTIADGKYAFGNMPFNSGNYTIKPGKNSDPLNGVTTADIVKIQRHILGLELLSSPYKIIAADVNNDKRITSKDISDLRRLILGIVDKFSNNESWAFIDATYQFIKTDVEVLDENYPRTFNVNPFNNDVNGVDFKGVKIGDVSGNASAGLHTATSRNGNDEILFIADEKEFAKDELVAIPVFLEKSTQLAGYQFTLKFDPSRLVFEGVEAGKSNITPENLGLIRTSDGYISFSWNTNKNIDILESEALFTLKFKALSQGQISNILQLNSIITPAQAFTTDAEERDIKLGFRTDNGIVENNSGLILYQNQPNPFSDLTVIGFELLQPAATTLTIYDLNSKVLYKSEIAAVKGYNSIEIQNAQLGVTGVLFYQIDAAGFTATKRMIVIK
ncbi:MAG: T9SS type A sorting domain-containing protein [Saprospiraceae bacterium]|nr:T9SS type A sorting domain-containing protein [Saprospiraceae bacterium]MBK9722256.1 T9SS type A sorting domain-containing protein [Saprospiraceae bacterium]